MSSLGFQTIYRGSERAARRGGRARLSARRRRAARASRRAAADVRDDAAGGRLPGRGLLARLRARAGRPARLPRHGRAFRSSPRSAPPARTGIRWWSPEDRSRSPTRSRAAPYVDVLVLGEAEETIVELVETIAASPSRAALLETLGVAARLLRAAGARRATAGGGRAPTTRCCRPTRRSSRRTPSCRTCSSSSPSAAAHRGCTYCVMRRSTNGGMRLVAPAKVASLIPSDGGASGWWAPR